MKAWENLTLGSFRSEGRPELILSILSKISALGRKFFFNVINLTLDVHEYRTYPISQ